MNENGLNPVDIAVIAVVLLSALLAFARGLVREVLSVGAWVGAAFLTLWAFPYASPYARGLVERQIVADGLAVVGVFVVALLVFSVLSHQLSSSIRDSALSAVDRSLGFGFGVVRGALLVSLAYLFMGWLWPEPPDWLVQAKTRPMLHSGAQLLRGLVPDRLDAPGTGPADRETAARRLLDPLSDPAPAMVKPGASDTDKGYKDQDRGQLNQLLETTAGPKPADPSR